MRAELGNRPKSHNFSRKKGRDPIDGDARVGILFIRGPYSSGFCRDNHRTPEEKNRAGRLLSGDCIDSGPGSGQGRESPEKAERERDGETLVARNIDLHRQS